MSLLPTEIASPEFSSVNKYSSKPGSKSLTILGPKNFGTSNLGALGRWIFNFPVIIENELFHLVKLNAAKNKNNKRIIKVETYGLY